MCDTVGLLVAYGYRAPAASSDHSSVQQDLFFLHFFPTHDDVISQAGSHRYTMTPLPPRPPPPPWFNSLAYLCAFPGFLQRDTESPPRRQQHATAGSRATPRAPPLCNSDAVQTVSGSVTSTSSPVNTDLVTFAGSTHLDALKK